MGYVVGGVVIVRDDITEFQGRYWDILENNLKIEEEKLIGKDRTLSLMCLGKNLLFYFKSLSNFYETF